jgi:uncharacterized protein YhbP (UPF0306 family)
MKEEPMDSAEPTAAVQPWVLEYLDAQQTLTLATASPRGVPHAATYLYVNDGMAIFFWMRPETVTAQHLEQNPTVSFAIDRQGTTWRESQSLQGSGECRMVLDPAELADLGERFGQKYATATAKRTSGLIFYRLTPTSLGFVGAAAAAGAGQLLGIEYNKQLIYSVFRDLPPQEVTTVAGRLDPMQVAAGTVVVRQGAPADKFFIIVEGELEVIREDGGVSRTVATLRKGQFFGEMAILRDLPRTATVRATTPATLLAMERDDFRALVAQSLATTQDFDQVIQQRLGELGGARGE